LVPIDGTVLWSYFFWGGGNGGRKSVFLAGKVKHNTKHIKKFFFSMKKNSKCAKKTNSKISFVLSVQKGPFSPLGGFFKRGDSLKVFFFEKKRKNFLNLFNVQSFRRARLSII